MKKFIHIIPAAFWSWPAGLMRRSLNLNTARLLDLRSDQAQIPREAEGIRRWTTPSLSTADQQRLLTDYNSLMDKLAEVNGENIHWWATDLASKNRFTSSLAASLTGLHLCIQALRALKAADGSWQDLIVLGADQAQMRFLLDQTDDMVEVRARRLPRLFSRLFGVVRTLGRMVRVAAIWTFRVLLCRWVMGIESPNTETRPVHLIKSFAFPNSFTPQGGFKDSFFPGLAETMQASLGQSDQETLTLVQCLTDPVSCLKALRHCARVAPIEAYLSVTDPLRAIIELWVGHLRKPFQVPGQLMFAGEDVSSAVRGILSSGGWHMPLEQYLHHAVGRHIARKHVLADCLLTYEGNPWERMLVSGLRESSPGLKVRGCQHAAPPPAAAGIFPGFAECRLAPLPDTIVCTGPKAAELIARNSAFPSERLVSACALRFKGLDSMAARTAPQESPSLLVALEGVPEVAPMLRYVFEEAARTPGLSLRLRAHPALSFSHLAAMLGNPALPSNVTVSVGSTLLEDIGGASIVMYWGSTVAAEALLMGKPVIHFDRGDVLSYDFLFDLHCGKLTVRPGVSLAEAFGILCDLEGSILHDAQDHVRSLFSSCDPQRMMLFLENEVLNDPCKQ